MLPNNFKPDRLYKLIRVGKDNDGGYLVCENSVNNSNILISFGISDDFSFEKHFQKINSINILAYDPTVNINFFLKKFLHSLIKFKFFLFLKQFYNWIKFKIFFSKSKNKLYLKKIGKGGAANYNYISIEDIISLSEDNEKIFFKIDIEGSEYRILDDLVKLSNKVEGLAIEFHDVDINVDKVVNFINKFSLKLVHIHANNWSTYGLNNIPSSIELSFSKNPTLVSNDITFPHTLDQKNNPDCDEIKLDFLNK
mgnify:CR=1 FL=1|tara:strand:- start:3338 stop:4096 length:759 start_codon:yes stop_codon:yes gene_type:complete